MRREEADWRPKNCSADRGRAEHENKPVSRFAWLIP